MEKRTHFYVSRKNALAWLMALCLVSSAVARIVIAGMKGAGDAQYVWSQIILPVVAALLYVYIVLKNGTERFYKTAIPIWMIAVYFGFSVVGYRFAKMEKLVYVLYWIALLFFAVIYTEITAGRGRLLWLLVPLFACPLLALLYLNRQALLYLRQMHLLQQHALELAALLPDILMLLGLMLCVFAIRFHPVGEYHPTWGDRTDGRRIRSLPPMSQVSPYIMVTRNSATNSYSEAFEITNVERYIRQKRREGLTSFGLMHVLLASYVRTVAKYPALNRFLSGQKVYSRGNDIQFCLTVKKEMSVDSPDTVIKVHLSPYDTADDVYRKLNEKVEEVKNTPLDSSFDNTAHVLTMLPGVFLKFTVWLLRTLDYFGMLPKFLLEVSPFHGSVFFTSMGSLGILSIYHHLYDFGNLPVFCSFGRKRQALEIQEDGTVVRRKYVDLKATLDERIVDGFYYAALFKYLKRIIAHPEVLDDPPQEVLRDMD